MLPSKAETLTMRATILIAATLSPYAPTTYGGAAGRPTLSPYAPTTYDTRKKNRKKYLKTLDTAGR
jgi:hypothetical protein